MRTKGGLHSPMALKISASPKAFSRVHHSEIPLRWGIYHALLFILPFPKPRPPYTTSFDFHKTLKLVKVGQRSSPVLLPLLTHSIGLRGKLKSWAPFCYSSQVFTLGLVDGLQRYTDPAEAIHKIVNMHSR